MANASAKKTASQNETVIQNLFYGQLLSHLLPLVVRWLLKTHTTKKVAFFFTFSFIVSQFIYHRLVKMGTPKRDNTGQLISSGEDLNQPGVTEWMFDVLYVAWATQIGSAIFGEWVWWLFTAIPVYVFYKLWYSFISPVLLGRPSSSGAEETQDPPENLSKRQEKLRKRSERGDSRVGKVQSGRR
ncbi:hypothetical protein HETIRDRAFT_123913 [Heterobasidion irregulare TC 32-1]|uniref:DUF788-domain-containing protein n=1 Tax=Heterobasidion irregulare (strain TC 32-1) TaxID=747525 RepID=W4KG69_HETIT|nr:uncharacterized protein HETIRDRAFT_123913 [Heterobasidion irregulare TC 32-1]ETW84285.1 hypothetical protein HETIRDRAFT_123913 [Heterobasidion irregulare TC 32-1]